jgi:hypothetical protein
MKPTITLDWNCVIAAENGEEPASSALDGLFQLHVAGDIDVALTLVSDSENLAGSREFPGSAEQFFMRLGALGWDALTLLPAPGAWSVTFWSDENEAPLSYCLDEEKPIEPLTDRIWDIIGGDTPRTLPDNLSDEEFHSWKFKKQRNVWCDVHTLFVHIDNRRDVFVTTNTRDFQNKLAQLEELGVGKIMLPSDCLIQDRRSLSP